MGHWADRAGLVLQFLSFWLLAPEFLGNERLRKIRMALTRVVQALLLVPIGAGLIALLAGLLLRQLDEDLHSVVRASIVSVLFLVGGTAIYLTMRKNLLERLLRHLEDDGRFRSALAAVGVAFFTIGFLLQLWATF